MTTTSDRMDRDARREVWFERASGRAEHDLQSLVIIERSAPCDPALLDQIGRLRVAVWSSKTTVARSVGECWTDRLDDQAIHWTVTRDDALRGAARLTTHHDWSDIAHGEAFAGCASGVRFPVALFGRLVLHPDVRGRGIAGRLDRARRAAARRLDARHALVFAPSHRLAGLEQIGFRVVGPSTCWPELPDVRSYPLALCLE